MVLLMLGIVGIIIVLLVVFGSNDLFIILNLLLVLFGGL